ncbi:MAG: type II toxin-antitoxin system PemK/MazF family toxin [Mobilitalea sp.]
MKIFSNNRPYTKRIMDITNANIKGINENDNVMKAMRANSYQKGDILLVDFGTNMEYCLTAGLRPAICISCAEFNERAPIMSVVPMTKHFKHLNMDSHVFIDKADCIGLWESGMAMCEQLRCVDRSQAIRKIASINDHKLMNKITKAIQIHFGTDEERA